MRSIAFKEEPSRSGRVPWGLATSQLYGVNTMANTQADSAANSRRNRADSRTRPFATGLVLLDYAANQVHAPGEVTTYVLQNKYLLTYVKIGRFAAEVLTCLRSSPHVVLKVVGSIKNKKIIIIIIKVLVTYVKFADEVLTYLCKNYLP